MIACSTKVSKEPFFDLTLLSVYRSALMGFSILLVIFYHFCNQGGSSFADKCFRFLFSQGYVGVDIFFVVSGLGLTYSLMNDDNLKRYYLKRWIRIFPFFIFITLVECWIIRGEPIELALLRSTTIGYWCGLPYIDWYIPALVGVYAVFPLIYLGVIRPRRLRLLLVGGFFVFLVSIFVAAFDTKYVDWKHFAMIYRIPDFFMGCVIAVAIKDGYKEKNVRTYVLISTIMAVLIVCVGKCANLHYSVWLANMCLTPLYLCILCFLFRKIDKSIKLNFLVTRPLAFLGLFTLEMYRISSSLERYLTDELCPNYHILFVFLYFVLCIFLSYIAYCVFKVANGFLYRKLSIFINK